MGEYLIDKRHLVEVMWNHCGDTSQAILSILKAYTDAPISGCLLLTPDMSYNWVQVDLKESDEYYIKWFKPDKLLVKE